MKMWKQRMGFLLFAPFLFAGCQKQSPFLKFQAEFYDLFDTVSVITGYAETESEFNRYAQIIYDRLKELNRLYDIYHDYPGIQNVKTINDNAGAQPVPVPQEIADLLRESIDYYESSGHTVNIALGPVLRLWHDYRTAGISDPATAAAPPMSDLARANQNTHIENVLIDLSAQTVFLRDKGMSLDVGAVAKGYAVKLAVADAVRAGMTSAIINIGGNVQSVGKPLGGARDQWGVGIQDPSKPAQGSENILDTIYINDMSVVTSGNYQRFYEVDGKIYSHIIDPERLMPAERYSAVTVAHPDAGVADMLSTALYILPLGDGQVLSKKYGAEALWIMQDGSLEATEGYKAMSKYFGYRPAA
ncbi:MAG: FAD:protein FMN transferase [Clostridiales bacterium]|jgi:thiamine biosynthesis lipoprotein|nr:FAD:protein FMN transferase [Clostridiales bacterium]